VLGEQFDGVWGDENRICIQKSDVIGPVLQSASKKTPCVTKLLESNVTQLNIRSPDAEKMK
jgi:hypothetical protein